MKDCSIIHCKNLPTEKQEVMLILILARVELKNSTKVIKSRNIELDVINNCINCIIEVTEKCQHLISNVIHVKIQP